MNTEISTHRLHLRLLQAQDVNAIFSYANDPEVSKNTAWPVHQSIADSEAFVSYVLSRNSLEIGHVRLVWGILKKGQDQLIGTISFKQDNDQEGHLDYALGRAFWGQGYITEAVAHTIEWLFDQLPHLESIHSGCLSRNIGSVKVLEKNGFQLVEQYSSKREGKFGGVLLKTSLFVKRRQ